jgi:PPOX class probable F420-dependent enzyme
VPQASLSPAQIALLEAQRVAHFATVDAAGRPHALPVCFAYLDGALYTPVDEKPKRGDPTALRRVRNIQAHPAVCLVVDHYEEDWTRLTWLQVRGTAALVDDSTERARALAALRVRYPQYRAMDLESRPLIRITPEYVAAWAATGSLDSNPAG